MTSYTGGRKKECLLLLMRHASGDSLEELFGTNDGHIANYKEFFTIQMDNNSRRELINRLEIKFKTINPESPKEELKYLLENSYYEINSEMLKAVTPVDLFDDEAFFTKNYTFIKHSGLNSMIGYIEEEINIYVKEILLTLGGNTREELEEYILLLNNADLDINLKEELIQKIDTLIQDINEIIYIEICHLFLRFLKVIPIW